MNTEIIQGIYEILNTKTSKRYIGSTNNIYRRWCEHKRELNNNKHHSIKLQRSWNKTKDKEIFKFNIIEIVNNDKILHIREQYYIDKYDSFYNGYNCSMVDNPKYTTKKLTKKQKELNKKIYFNEFTKLFDEYKNKIEISNNYISKLNNYHYSEKIYNTVVQLILEYEKYFNKDEYYIQLYTNIFEIRSYNRNPMISYYYKLISGNLILNEIGKNTNYIKDKEEKVKYLYK